MTDTPALTSPDGEAPWIEWHGGDCPVAPDTMIEIKHVMPGDAEARVLFPRMAWANAWHSPCLIAYRLVQS